MARLATRAAIVLLTAASCPLTPVFAGSASHVYSGTLATTAVTAACASVAEVHAQPALYRPHILAADPKPAIVLASEDASGGSGQLQARTNAGNMNGAGTYDGTYFDPVSGQTHLWTGTYSLTVTPAPVRATTVYIYVTGTISNFANVAGCTMTINGAFLQPVAAN